MVWGKDCMILHLADLARGFFPGESQTLCGRPVFVPVIARPNIEKDLKEGEHNCPKCFRKKETK